MTNQTATIIRDQIGAKALYMLGAKNLLAGENWLSFRVRGSKRVNYVKVTLNSMDLYDMKFSKVRGGKNPSEKVIAEHSGLYFDMLNKTIEEETGLYTSL